MKLRNKIAAITAAAMLALTGVGFGAWVFGHEATYQESSVANEITAAVDLTGLSSNVSGLKIVLDQPAKTGYNEQGKGVYWADSTGAAVTALTLTPTIAYRSGSDTPTYEYSFSKTFTHAALDSYVTFGADALSPSATGTFTEAAPLGAFTYTLPALSYAHEPTSLAEYDAMVAALDSATVSFSFTLNITDNVA